mmetsp:Transcript_15427/g.27192  ORF Transcript_15427/g.27192 Transcript_15427/m.27192 type:complete len:372 (-) Transcript_15427:32-1147(-)
MLAPTAVILVLLLCCREGLGIPQAIVHIGPHKTASTYIQSVLLSLTKELANVNYYWPTRTNGSPMGTKDTANFALALRSLQISNPAGEISNMASFFNSSLHQNRNIILSSEEFDDMNVTQVATLKNHLQGFNVTIVFVYREFLAQLISLHFELHRVEHAQFSKSFSGFLFGIMNNLPLNVRPIDILKNFGAVFGVGNIRIIDMLGAEAAKEDLAHILLCKIGGILCGHKQFSHVHRPNSAYSLIPAQMFSFYKSYVYLQHNGTCYFCGHVLPEYNQFAVRYKEHLKVHAAPEITVTKLSLLVPYSQQTDAILRDTYGTAILYGNLEANQQAMAKAQVQEVDVEKFMTDLYWNQWLESEYKAALAEKKICGC